MDPQLACVYASLILHDEGVDITGGKIQDILKAANVTIDPFWPKLFSDFCKGKNLDDFLGAMPSGGAAVGGGGAAPAAEEAAVEEEAQEEEEEEESDEDMGFGLFD